MDNFCQLLIIQVVSPAVQLNFERFPYWMPTEVIFLKQKYLSEVDEGRGEKLRYSLSNVQEEHFVDGVGTTLFNHSLEALLRHLYYFLKRLIQLYFS